MDSPTRQLHQQVFSAETASSIDEFINKLKRGHLQGSKKIALETANLMRQLVSNSRWDDATTLTQLLITVGRRLIKAQPRELLIMNIVCRVIHIVNEVAPTQPSTPTTPRGEFSASVSRGSMTPAMGLGVGAGVGGGNGNGNGSGSGSGARSGFVDQVAGALAKQQHESQGAFRLKQEIIGEINEYIIELESCEEDIAKNALQHIHSNEVILICGRSRTVEEFLLAAARKRKFHVIVTECAPAYDGHEQAKALESPNIEVVVIPDAAVFAIMARVNKVILGTHAVLANGGLVAVSGAHMVAAAARHHSAQVVVCAGLYKHAPAFPFDDDRFNTLVSPDAVLPYGDGDLVDAVDAVSPCYDYVPPDLVDILVDSEGGHLTSYLYHLLQENYSSAKDLAWILDDQ